VGAGTRRQVLIIDNNEDVLATLDRELKEVGYDTVTTWSGVEGLSLLKSRTFDSVLVDAYLSDLYIGDFLGRVSRLPVWPRVLVMQARSGKAVDLPESGGLGRMWIRGKSPHSSRSLTPIMAGFIETHDVPQTAA
jgi:CheY-like chemotaxis protein